MSKKINFRNLLNASLLLLLLIHVSCLKPNKVSVKVEGNNVVIENNHISAIWKVEDSTLFLDKIYNKKDTSSINLNTVNMFKIYLKGTALTNLDFKIIGTPKVVEIKPSDSLPTFALKEKGKEVELVLVNRDHQLQINWSAVLRDNSHYIRQQLELIPLTDSVYVDKIALLDGKLSGGSISGNVLGSPIVAGNYFFGYEHPTALSETLDKTMIKYFSHKSNDPTAYTDTSSVLQIDLKDIDLHSDKLVINYLPDNIVHGFNIHRVSLLEDNNKISEDVHSMYGEASDPDYILDLPLKKGASGYTLEVELSNTKDCAGQFFLIQEENGHLNFYTKKEMYLAKDRAFWESCVMGVVEEGQMRRGFLDYIERERAKPYSQFLHYNSWYDLSEDNVSYNLEQAKDVINGWGEKFIKPYGIDFGGFALDDGWDDLNDLWRFNKEDFPNGFVPLAELAKQYDTGIGAWMSPFGGYAEPKKKRVATAVRDGFEITDKGLSLAGSNYYNRFLESALMLIKDNEVNYFKFDGFGGSNPKYLPEMEAATRLVRELRKEKPDVFINVTTGTWPSPFWLLTTDCTWRGGWDMQQAGVGNKTQKWITFRDGALYNNVVRRAPLYPLNSIMHHGIVYANRSHGKNYTTDSNSDFADQVFSFFGSGTSLQELYISHDRMNKTKWRILAKGAKWAKDNEEVLVDTHWIGGDPFNLDIYGWASWNGEKGIVTIRNPSNKEQSYTLNLGRTLEENQKGIQYHISEPFINKMSDLKIINGTVLISLKPFEGKVIEITKF